MKEYKRRIYYYETDRMNYVHNSNYLRLFEEARLDYMRQTGVDYHSMEDAGIIIPVVEAHVKYGSPLRYDDEVTIRTIVTEFNGIRLKFAYEIYPNGSDKPSTTGWTSHCFLDDETRHPLSIKKNMPEAYKAVIDSMQE
ncbi:MAG: acyl-CoA thioesterase [Lachnospiraceae bacterium]|jgi:acyl-CoA thioester hydrolase